MSRHLPHLSNICPHTPSHPAAQAPGGYPQSHIIPVLRPVLIYQAKYPNVLTRRASPASRSLLGKAKSTSVFFCKSLFPPAKFVGCARWRGVGFASCTTPDCVQKACRRPAARTAHAHSRCASFFCSRVSRRARPARSSSRQACSPLCLTRFVASFSTFMILQSRMPGSTRGGVDGRAGCQHPHAGQAGCGSGHVILDHVLTFGVVRWALNVIPRVV